MVESNTSTTRLSLLFFLLSLNFSRRYSVKQENDAQNNNRDEQHKLLRYVDNQIEHGVLVSSYFEEAIYILAESANYQELGRIWTVNTLLGLAAYTL